MAALPSGASLLFREQLIFLPRFYSTVVTVHLPPWMTGGLKVRSQRLRGNKDNEPSISSELIGVKELV